MRALRSSLDLDSPFGAAVWAAACSAYHGCRRLGELLIRSASKFTTNCRSTRISHSRANGREVRDIHLVWTKTTTTAGECILTEIVGRDADLCPVWAFNNHCRVNHSPPANTPLFAFRSTASCITQRTYVFTTGSLELVFGHSYRISGSLALLAVGVAPEVIMKLGCWSSLCFLIYWHRLEKILPLAITRAWDACIAEFTVSHGHPSGRDVALFDL
ncbi:hypothetical protein FB451DRAFT_1258048 [Mycena latifolia]|nr:hypothetical protein FB451DRAFT_1258048 [Mycena latifolia]